MILFGLYFSIVIKKSALGTIFTSSILVVIGFRRKTSGAKASDWVHLIEVNIQSFERKLTISLIQKRDALRNKAGAE